MTLQTIKDLVSTTATLAALLIAWRGLSTWRRQMYTTRDSELAKCILVALYRAEAAIEEIRSPFVEVIIPREEEREPKAYERNWAKMYENRWRRLTEILADLQAGAIEAKAVWDREFPAATKAFFICVSELHSHLNDLIQCKLDQHHEQVYESKENRDVVYAKLGSPDKDEFGGRIKRAVALVDEAVRSHLEKGVRGRWTLRRRRKTE